jgi:hypothetical protein
VIKLDQRNKGRERLLENKPKRFKKFLKRMNRGVALGLALVVILVGYSIVYGAIFENKHRGDIEELVREYGVDIIKINDAIKETKVGERLTANDIASMRAALEDVIGKYYTSSKDAFRTYSRNSRNGIELLEEFDESSAAMRGFKLESVEAMLPTVNSYGHIYSDMNMSKLAGKFVHVSIYTNYEVTYIISDPQSMPFFGIGDSKYVIMEDYGEKAAAPDYGYSEDIPGNDGGIYRVKSTIQVSGTIKLVREDGEWRIACTEWLSAHIMNSTQSPVEVKVNG